MKKKKILLMRVFGKRLALKMRLSKSRTEAKFLRWQIISSLVMGQCLKFIKTSDKLSLSDLDKFLTKF